MRKAPVPLPAAPTPLEVLRDVLLFQADYAFAYYIFLALYCAACCRNLKEALPRLTWFYAIPLAVLTSFGGGIMVPVLLGLPAAPLINEAHRHPHAGSLTRWPTPPAPRLAPAPRRTHSTPTATPPTFAGADPDHDYRVGVRAVLAPCARPAAEPVRPRGLQLWL